MTAPAKAPVFVRSPLHEDFTMAEAGRLAGLLRALADPTRLLIIAELARGPATGAELGRAFPRNLTQPTFSHHLTVLDAAGVITTEREGTRLVRHLNRTTLIFLGRAIRGDA